ncbi:MAG: MFS transporter [Actinobacteria bacterium]|nr:MFS transporter [Actinomycetota bacterium]
MKIGAKKSGLTDILGNRNFRLLWSGEGISLLGDQFSLIALPWLVLKLTGSALAIGTVLALAAIPRALFMLVGGALTDRLSPRSLMLCSNVSRFVLVGGLALLTVTGSIELWMLYAFALLFGLADAFFFPAQSAIIPHLLGKDRLQAGNAIIQGTAQLSVFLGPVLAGILIAVLDGGGVANPAVPDMWGIGVAFALDAASFLASAATLAMIKLPAVANADDSNVEKGGVLSSIREVLATVWRDRTLRYYFVLIAAVNLLMAGPISVGIPVLADTKFAGGAAAFGIILSGFGGGSLIGVIVAGVMRRPASKMFPVLMLGLTGAMGLGLVLLGVLSSTEPAAIVAFGMGLGQGYVVVQFITWLQLRTPARMLGRTMSVLMFAVVGLSPVSSTIAGALIQWSASAVMIGAGVLMVGVVSVAALSPSVWRLGDQENEAPAAAPALAGR